MKTQKPNNVKTQKPVFFANWNNKEHTNDIYSCTILGVYQHVDTNFRITDLEFEELSRELMKKYEYYNEAEIYSAIPEINDIVYFETEIDALDHLNKLINSTEFLTVEPFIDFNL